MNIACTAGFIALVSAAIATAAETRAEPRLTGIVFWKNTPQALLELPSKNGSIRNVILRPGDRFEAYEVKVIDDAAGTIELFVRSEDRKAILDLGLPAEEKLSRRTLNFRAARLDQVLEVYQEISGRTVIRSGALIISKIDLKSDADLSVADALAALEKSIAQSKLTLKPIETKFVFAFGQGDEKRIETLRAAPTLDGNAEEKFPPGLIKFQEADPLQVLDVYAEVVGRTVLKPDRLRGDKVTVRSQTELSRDEAAWLIEASLLLGRIMIVPVPNENKVVNAISVEGVRGLGAPETVTIRPSAGH